VRPTKAPPAKQAAKTSKQRPAASFLQLRGSGGLSDSRRTSGAHAIQDKVVQRLLGAANHLRSPVLSVTAIKVQAAEDHFEKVRSLIKDIIGRLEADAEAEANTKTFCDEEMEKTTGSRDSKKEELESLAPQIISKEAEKAQLLEEIAALSKDIAANKKALSEATELRADEKADNADTVEHAKAGKEAVDLAITMLRDFYGSEGAFLQHSTGYVPKNADRDGKSVADFAPEITDQAEFTKRHDATKGILGMLDVILTDFERTVTTTEENEKLSEEAFVEFKKATEGDTEQKEESKTSKEGEVTIIEDDVVGLIDSKTAAQEAYDLALSELEKLKKMCVDGESYEDRAAKRKQEIEALKEAHAMLESWQG